MDGRGAHRSAGVVSYTSGGRVGGSTSAPSLPTQEPPPPPLSESRGLWEFAVDLLRK